jgi:hypothetical protein
MVPHDCLTLLNHVTGKKTVDYTGRTVGSIVVKGLIDGWESKDLLKDNVWVLYCTEYDCLRTVSVKTLRPMLSTGVATGKYWDSRYDKFIGNVYPGTTLTILGHESRQRKKGDKMGYERYFNCQCSISGATRWVTVNDVFSGNTTTLKNYASLRPEGLLIDPDLDDFIGLNSVYKGITVQATDGRGLTYYRVTINGLPQLLHRVAWFVRYGVWTNRSQEIHHINHNTLDNRISNLELLDRKGIRNNSQSLHKMKTQGGRPVSSAYKGVSWDKSKGLWKACCTLRNKSVHIGRYKTEAEARDAYDAFVENLNKEYGCIFTLNRDLHLLP